MKIKISEVWNGGSDKSEELAIIETTPSEAKQDVFAWIHKNRPDLRLNTSISGHGFHAIKIGG